MNKKSSLKSLISESFWSEWRGSNPRPDGPKPPALPTALHPAMKLKFCCDCGQSCGHCRFSARFDRLLKSRKFRRCKVFRRFGLPRLGYRHGTPKPPALPTALHPVIQFIYPAGRIHPNHPPGSGRHDCRAEDMASHGNSPNIIHHPSAARQYFLIDVCARLCYSDTIQKVRRMTP